MSGQMEWNWHYSTVTAVSKTACQLVKYWRQLLTVHIRCRGVASWQVNWLSNNNWLVELPPSCSSVSFFPPPSLQTMAHDRGGRAMDAADTARISDLCSLAVPHRFHLYTSACVIDGLITSVVGVTLHVNRVNNCTSCKSGISVSGYSVL